VVDLANVQQALSNQNISNQHLWLTSSITGK